MVKAGPVSVTATRIPIEFQGIAASWWPELVPFDTTIYSYVRRRDTGERIDGVGVMLTVSFNKGPRTVVGETYTKHKDCEHGYCGISTRIKEAGEYSFILSSFTAEHELIFTPELILKARRKRTDMYIASSRGDPAPNEPYTIYGRLSRLEPDVKYLNGKTVKLYEREKGGTYGLIANLKTFTKTIEGKPYEGWYERTGIKKASGIWEYLAEFEGDAEYEGCSRQSSGAASLGPVYFY